MSSSARQAVKKEPTKGQIKMIHALAAALEDDEPHYRVVLYHNFKVMSSKSLTFDQANQLIDVLQAQAVKDGVWVKNTAFEEFGNRAGFANPLQLRKIETLWRGVTDLKDEEERKESLRSFLFNRFHVSDMRFVKEEQVTGIMTALRCMKVRKEGDHGKTPRAPSGRRESL